jgi:hypothetical protein
MLPDVDDHRTERASLAAAWTLVTAPDERERCCLVTGGERCVQPTAFRIAAADGALDDYTWTCARHVELVSGAGYVVTAVEPLPVLPVIV